MCPFLWVTFIYMLIQIQRKDNFNGTWICTHTIQSIRNKLHPSTFFKKKLIFSKTKETESLLFLVGHYAIKTDIICYYLLPNSVALKS